MVVPSARPGTPQASTFGFDIRICRRSPIRGQPDGMADLVRGVTPLSDPANPPCRSRQEDSDRGYDLGAARVRRCFRPLERATALSSSSAAASGSSEVTPKPPKIATPSIVRWGASSFRSTAWTAVTEPADPDDLRADPPARRDDDLGATEDGADLESCPGRVEDRIAKVDDAAAIPAIDGARRGSSFAVLRNDNGSKIATSRTSSASGVSSGSMLSFRRPGRQHPHDRRQHEPAREQPEQSPDDLHCLDSSFLPRRITVAMH